MDEIIMIILLSISIVPISFAIGLIISIIIKGEEL